MKFHTAFIGITLVLASCGGPEDRPISEALTSREIGVLLQKNPGYEEAVSMAERFRLSASTADMARANGLTYEALQQFLDARSDKELRNRLQKEADTEWTALYGPTAEQVPGLIARWRDYVDSLRPDRYISVRLLAIDPKESIYGAARVTLEFAPTRGAIDRIKGRFGLFPRHKVHEFDDFSIAKHNNFDFPQGLRNPVVKSTWMRYSIWDIADGDIAYNMYPDRPGLPISELLEKYVFDYSVSELVTDGRELNLSEIYEKVPQSIRNYWETGDEEHPEQTEKQLTDIARELLMPEFVGRTQFIRNYDENYFRKRDSLAAWLVLDRNI